MIPYGFPCETFFRVYLAGYGDGCEDATPGFYRWLHRLAGG